MYEHDRRGFYRILESTPNSSASELKRSYRRLAMSYHPDREQDPERRTIQQEQMRLLNEAYEFLRDEGRRSSYDRECGFARCSMHPDRFIWGECTRCRIRVCPECASFNHSDNHSGNHSDNHSDNHSGSVIRCAGCEELSARRKRTLDPVERALLAMEDGDLVEAQQSLRRALLVNPRDVVALTALSLLREKHEDWRGAMMALQAAIQLKPGHAFSHYRLGRIHRKMGNIALAREAFDEALRIDPGSAKYRGALSTLAESASPPSNSRFRVHDAVRHEVFGAGVVTEVSDIGVRVRFGEGTLRWLDPARAPMTHRAVSTANP